MAPACSKCFGGSLLSRGTKVFNQTDVTLCDLIPPSPFPDSYFLLLWQSWTVCELVHDAYLLRALPPAWTTPAHLGISSRNHPRYSHKASHLHNPAQLLQAFCPCPRHISGLLLTIHHFSICVSYLFDYMPKSRHSILFISSYFIPSIMPNTN